MKRYVQIVKQRIEQMLNSVTECGQIYFDIYK